jgi:hypothetical protein
MHMTQELEVKPRCLGDGDPGRQTWLDTAGYPTGQSETLDGMPFHCHSIGQEGRIADLPTLPPPGTATATTDERDKIIHDRCAQLWQRRLS